MNDRLPRRVDGVVFDMDGLLVDSEGLYRDVMMQVARDMGEDLPLPVFLRMVGMPSIDSRRVAREHFGEDFAMEDFDKAVWARVIAEQEVGVALKAGVTELLDHLDAAGLPAAVATSSSLATAERQLGKAGVFGRFETFVTAGDCARGKPHPEPFLLAAERLGLDPRHCLALEDSHNGVRAAHAAGMMTVMVPDLLEATEEMRGLCIAIAETLHHVQAMLPQGANRVR